MTEERLVVDFPLRGEWVAYHTPAERVPSHGTDQLGQRYAYDFLRIASDHEGWKFSTAPTHRHHLVGVPLRDCYGWGEPIMAPFGGTVISLHDGMAERDPVYFLRDFGCVLKNALLFDPKKDNALSRVLGNHVVLRMFDQDVYALFAHARCGSLRVREGDDVTIGEHIADVGHSGNSTAPHLHFQLMNGPDACVAVGLPCAFRSYESLSSGVWREVTDGIPAKREFVRFRGHHS